MRHRMQLDAASRSADRSTSLTTYGTGVQEREKVRDRARRDAATASEERVEEKKKLKADERRHKEDERRAKEEGDEARRAQKAHEKAARQARQLSRVSTCCP